MTVRAKFRVHNVDRSQYGTTVKLSPVYSGSPENEQFFKATPGGEVALYTLNAAAGEQFELGDEFYVDFTLAKREPKPEPAAA